MKLDAKAAADRIRGEVALDASASIPPEDQHRLRYVTEVCEHLELDPNPVNVHHVAEVLKRHGVDEYIPDEYPKWVDHHDGTKRLVVHNEEDERRATDPDYGDDETQHVVPEPTNKMTYGEYMRDWVRHYSSREAAEARWAQEADMRHELEMSPDDERELHDHLERTVSATGPNAPRNPEPYEPGGLPGETGAQGSPRHPAAPARPTSDARPGWDDRSTPGNVLPGGIDQRQGRPESDGDFQRIEGDSNAVTRQDSDEAQEEAYGAASPNRKASVETAPSPRNRPAPAKRP